MLGSGAFTISFLPSQNSSKRLAVDGDVLGEAPRQFVEIGAGAVVAATPIMDAGCDMAAARHAPGRVVPERGHALDHMPMPRHGQAAEHVFVVADEWFAVEDDGKKVNGQRVADPAGRGATAKH